MKTLTRRLIASTLIVSCSLMSLSAQAVIVPTEALLPAEAAAGTTLSAEAARARVGDFLARDDVRQALMGQGVDAEAAQARVAALSDTEVAELAGRIDSAPAGGEVLGLLFTVFVILLVTDILGLTKVFPFTRSVR
ncbi:PA2779 family protein [Paucibacter sp. O1-1]|nr:PA2779 family protein [Paucibacter sp. O1-1]MDA3824584.1 PA2779 family protein [Paucibacter sp. O1-1]